MNFKKNKAYILLIAILYILFNGTKNNNSFNLNKKSNLRKLGWEEKVIFNRYENKDDDDETKSIKHCKTGYYTDYKYNIFYEVGKEYIDLKKLNPALHKLVENNNYYPSLLLDAIKKANDEDYVSQDSASYLRQIGLFFSFVACAGVSIIVWIFNWICWLNQCCCCDFLHNPVNKRIAWWTSFIFLLGVLACCISGFVEVKRFGFALEGSRCAFDRIYYDGLYGQLKNSDDRWKGIEDIQQFVKNCFEKDGVPGKTDFEEGIRKDIFMNFFHEKEDILQVSLNKLAMAYFCLFLIAVVSAEVSMMFYACLKRQGYLITLMHVLWNVIRFFIFSFFLYGTAYGVFFLILSDLIGVMKNIFTNLTENPASVFLKGCLSLLDKEDTGENDDDNVIKYLKEYFNGKKSCNDELDCSFLKSDLNHLYKALDDASSESQKLSAISLCAAFFGAVAIYFYLLVMHHYNNELFFDSGKSIFTGFDGFGRGYKNKNRNNDPAYKKRKLRAEIELTSKNDDQNEYKDINKNDDD